MSITDDEKTKNRFRNKIKKFFVVFTAYPFHLVFLVGNIIAVIDSVKILDFYKQRIMLGLIYFMIVLVIIGIKLILILYDSKKNHRSAAVLVIGSIVFLIFFFIFTPHSFYDRYKWLSGYFTIIYRTQEYLVPITTYFILSGLICFFYKIFYNDFREIFEPNKEDEKIIYQLEKCCLVILGTAIIVLSFIITQYTPVYRKLKFISIFLFVFYVLILIALLLLIAIEKTIKKGLNKIIRYQRWKKERKEKKKEIEYRYKIIKSSSSPKTKQDQSKEYISTTKENDLQDNNLKNDKSNHNNFKKIFSKKPVSHSSAKKKNGKVRSKSKKTKSVSHQSKNDNKRVISSKNKKRLDDDRESPLIPLTIKERRKRMFEELDRKFVYEGIYSKKKVKEGRIND